MNTLKAYITNVRRFSPQARLYLLVTLLQGIGFGVFQLFFNFYILSLGYKRDTLGLLISIPPLTALFAALFAGYISELLGRKKTFILGNLITAGAQALMLLFPSLPLLILAGVLRGLGQSLFRVSTSPFLMENSGEAERTHLFSLNMGLRNLSQFLGNYLGGGLPLLFGNFLNISATSSYAYACALAITTLFTGLTLLPLSQLKDQQRDSVKKDPGKPIQALWENRRGMVRLLLPALVLSLGAGMLIPFLNVFFKFEYNLSDGTIGKLFGFGSLSMAIAFVIAPVLAERWGKAKTVVLSQGLAIVFLIILGFTNNLNLVVVAFLARMALMNMSSPVYQTMVMEETKAESRGMAASFYSMIWSSGRAISPVISGPIQTAYGFDPVFVITIVAYIISVALVYLWFIHGSTRKIKVVIQPETG